jgi:putative ABC transport system permease protein
MYTYKYPEQTVPKGGEPACAVTLSRASFGYEFDVSLLGIEENTPYFDLDLRKNREDVMISSAMAQKFGFTVGEEIVLEDRENDQLYAFRVSGITQYSPGFFVFMDLETMRDMFGFDEDYYNVVFADKALDIPSGRLYATLDKEKVIASAGVFVELMYSMIYIMIGVSVVIFIIVMYLMLGVMVDNSSYDISLMKIFGYKRSEIRKLYLNGNFYIVAIGTLIVLPLSKLIINSLYPYFISNVTCAMDLSMSPLVYVGIYIAIIAIYLLVSFFLNRKIDAVSIQEVLKNRE